MAGIAAVVKESVMLPDIEQDCVDCAAYALTRPELGEQRSVAQFIKKELDGKYGRQWHVIVGLFFGSYVSHDAKEYVYFHIDDLAFLIWRTEWSGKEVAVPTYPVRGRVVSSLTREHVFGARIECGSTVVHAGPSGAFELPMIYGPATVLVSARGHRDHSRPVIVERNGTVDLGDVVLSSDMQRRTGDVVDAATNAPLSGVTLTIAGSSVRTVKTDAAGAFAFDSTPGTYEVVFSRRGYFKKATRIDVTEPAEGGWTAESLGVVQLAPFPQCAALRDVVSVATAKRHFAVVIDHSESMNEGTRWDDARDALQVVANAVIGAGATLDVTMFSTRATTKAACKTVAQALAHFDSVVPDGSTDLAAALSATFAARPAAAEPTTVLVLLDGVPNAVPEALSALESAAGAATEGSLRVSFVGIGSESHLEKFLTQVEGTDAASTLGVVDVVRESQCGGEQVGGLVRGLLNA